MCGIFGSNGSNTLEPNLMASLIRRRGPDDKGIWADQDAAILLGQVRLSIIDVSSDGHQPMISHDGRVVMIYNGEVYNYRELRAELEADGVRFRGASDSEVVLALFARDGIACLPRLNGIFAVAFWERDRNTLTLARDPMGVKPLYVAEQGGSLHFASEMKALLRSGLIKRELNPSAVLAHLGLVWSPGSQTVAKGIRKLLPGHLMVVKNGNVLEERSYADLHFNESAGPQDSEAAIQSVRAALQVAVERQMVSDVPLGAFLSGGLDSSAIVAFAQRHLSKNGGNRLQCFSIEIGDSSMGDEGFAEDLPYARKVAAHVGTDLHVVKVGSEMMDRLGEMIYLLDEPTPDPAALNTMLISELARSQGIKVLLSGAGGDDIFTGYRRHFALTQERWWAGWPPAIRGAMASMARMLPADIPLLRRVGKAFTYAGDDADRRLASYFFWLEPQQALRLLAPEFRAGLDADSMYAPLLKSLARLPDNVSPLNRMLYLECKHFLADHNLNYADKMGMAAGVEIRVPLLDLDLVALAGTLPVSMKQNGRTGKWILKKALEPYLPSDVIYRPKTGFGAPLRKWLHGPLAPMVSDLLSPGSLRARGIFDEREVADLLRRDRSGQVDASYTIFGMLCMELWCRQYMDGSFMLDADFKANDALRFA